MTDIGAENQAAYMECVHSAACALHADPDTLECADCTEWADFRPKAVRVTHVHGAIGHCECSACHWRVDPRDRYCRRCGAYFTGDKRIGGQ